MPLDRALTRIADLARHTVPGADEVSVTLLGPGGAHTAAFTGRTALVMDEWQYEHGHGPCLAAAAANITVTVDDAAGEARWPQWADEAIEAGVHSSLSVGLPLQRSLSGALNVYSTAPQAFDEDAVILAQTFAGYAAVAMANAPGAGGTGGTEATAVDSRVVIEQAKGIIMADRRCSSDEATAVLAKMSAYSRRTVGGVATMLVTQTGRPDGGR
jgi:hypothetical protein